MPRWQKSIFTGLVHNSGSPASDFCLPAERTTPPRPKAGSRIPAVVKRATVKSPFPPPAATSSPLGWIIWRGPCGEDFQGLLAAICGEAD